MIKLELVGVSEPDPHGSSLVILRGASRILPIVIGPSEAFAIKIVLMNQGPPRPLTHDLIVNLLAGLRGNIQSVAIYKLENGTFFAHLNIEQISPTGQVEQVLRVDARPSDGIAIAVRTQCPVFVAEEVMDAAGQDPSVLDGSSEGEVDDDDEDEDADDEHLDA